MRLRAEPGRRPLHPAAAGALLLCGALLISLARSFPFGRLPALCLFKLWTSQPCLTCGMTRSWVAMAEGRVPAALQQNPLGALLFVATVLGMVYGVGRQLRLPAVVLDASPREHMLLRWGVVALVGANWAYVAISGVA